jgi:hypothetical protein
MKAGNDQDTGCNNQTRKNFSPDKDSLNKNINVAGKNQRKYYFF